MWEHSRQLEHGRQFTPLISIAAKLNSFKGGVKLPTVNNTPSIPQPSYNMK